MKLKRLELTAYGPFTGKILEFSGDKPGLHIIFGPNEAGKSSALRALRSLLYGFPQQTPDDFFHSYAQLLVGGCLENRDGNELCFQRRKKRIGDIIDKEGNPLEPGVLSPFLHGMAAEIFDTLYGIDHNSLLRGGEEILARKGEVGQALFSAGAGVTSLAEVIEQLEEEASSLFKPAGQLPEINKAVKRFKELKKEARDVALSAKEWKSLQQSLHRAQLERAELERERDKNQRELQRLERLQRAIPELASLKAWRTQLQPLGRVTLLPPDFTTEYQQVRQQSREAELRLQTDYDRLQQARRNREAVTLNRELLARAALVEDLQLRLGEYRKGQKDRPERNGMRITLRKEAAALLREVRPDVSLADVETVRPVLSKKRTIQTLAARYGAISEQLKQAENSRTTAERELKEVEEFLTALPEAATSRKLVQAVKPARKSGDIDSRIEQEKNELEGERKAAFSELKRLGIPSKDLAALLELRLPLSPTVQQFQTEFTALLERARDLKNDQKNSERELETATAEIRKMAYSGELPSEDELTRVRKKRDTGWQLLRRRWIEGKNIDGESDLYGSGRPLPDVYEEYVSLADLVGDRLRREADRIAGRATFQARAEAAKERLQQNEKQHLAAEQCRKKLDRDWNKIWLAAKITPLSPEEMRGWLAEVDKLRYRAGEILKKEHEIDLLEKRREQLRIAVVKELEMMGEVEAATDHTLGPLLGFAENVIEKAAALQTSRETTEEKKKKARRALELAEKEVKTGRKEMAAWRLQWRTAVSGLDPENELSTLEAVDLIDILQNCFNKLKEAEDLQARIEGIDRDGTELENDVRALLEKTAPEMMDQPLEQAILQLRVMLGQAQTNSTLHEKLCQECDTLQLDVLAAEKVRKDADEQMAELLRIAECDESDKLPAVIAKFAEYQKLQEKISETEASLARIGSGITIEELARQADKIDADELQTLSDALRRQVDEEINPGINAISQEIGKQTNSLAAMDGNAKSAETAEKMEQELARLRHLTERYTEVRLASKILQLEIERYREEHQDPILRIGADYFAKLTMGSFTNLKTDLDDRGNPILVGIRSDQNRVTVEGMSDGTRDQLYLALRLATLEFRLESSEPMPFIVDDILINFDDQRSRTTLEALAELGEKNQILLFTHHHRIVEETKKLQIAAEIHLHTL
ncbi:MAG: AAA family ATPase [Deltaproteobacteria bacterium]|nr:AAA family ATPase [Deltaproteobacteria bacterium]